MFVKYVAASVVENLYEGESHCHQNGRCNLGIAEVLQQAAVVPIFQEEVQKEEREKGIRRLSGSCIGHGGQLSGYREEMSRIESML